MTTQEKKSETERIECCHISAKEGIAIAKLLALIIASVIVFKYFITA